MHHVDLAGSMDQALILLTSIFLSGSHADGHSPATQSKPGCALQLVSMARGASSGMPRPDVVGSGDTRERYSRYR